MSDYLKDNPTRYEVMMGLLPSYYQDSPQMQNIQEALSVEIQSIRDLNDKLINETFISLAEDSMARYEKMLDIKQQVGDTIETRRQRIISRLSFHPPLNISQLKTIVNQFVTSGTVDVQELPGEYAIAIVFPPNAAYNYGDITSAVEYAKPAHLEAMYTSDVVQNAIIVRINEFIDTSVPFRLCNTFNCGEAY